MFSYGQSSGLSTIVAADADVEHGLPQRVRHHDDDPLPQAAARGSHARLLDGVEDTHINIIGQAEPEQPIAVHTNHTFAEGRRTAPRGVAGRSRRSVAARSSLEPPKTLELSQDIYTWWYVTQ